MSTPAALPSPDFSTYTKDHWSCLLYIESLIVDNNGSTCRKDPRMNDADWDAAERFVADGLLVWGGTGMHPVFSFTDRGWAIAHAFRRARAERVTREHWPDVAASAAKPQGSPTFEEVWAGKEAEGYQYGPDALELVRFGWSLACDVADAGRATGPILLADMSKTTQPRTVSEYRAALAQWLRDLADAVEGQSVVESDVAQALFANDTYKVGCPISEAANEARRGDDAAERLLQGIEALYPLPKLEDW